MLERTLENKLKATVAHLGGVCFKLDASSVKGVPDRVVVLDGRVFFLELKTESGRVSHLQAHVHARIRKAGGEVLVCYGWDEIRRALG